MYDMINIFEVFLPQLLRYPNPTDPLNGEAAALLMREPTSYDTKVKGVFSLLSPRVSDRTGLLTGVSFLQQNTSKSTLARRRRTKRAPRAKTTTTCPR
jgi:hypothetical protein